MAYDEDLAERIRRLMPTGVEVTEQRMFGGLAFLVGGHMAISASGQGGLLVRVDPTDEASLLDQPHTEPMVMRGRPMSGWLRVAAEGSMDEAELSHWVKIGVGYAGSLPPKPG